MNSTRYQTGINNDQPSFFRSWKDRDADITPVVISSLEPRRARGHTGCRAWITVQTYINDTLRCGPEGFRLRLFLFADRKSGEVRRENRPKAYVVRHERDGVAAKIATAVSSYDFAFLPSPLTIHQNAWRLHIFRILKQIVSFVVPSHVEYFLKNLVSRNNRKTRLRFFSFF